MEKGPGRYKKTAETIVQTFSKNTQIPQKIYLLDIRDTGQIVDYTQVVLIVLITPKNVSILFIIQIFVMTL